MTGLAVPTPAQVSPGNFMTAALWNANVFNGLTYLLNPPQCHAWQSAAQSLANNTWTSLSLNNTTTDPYAGHSDTTNNSRYTAQVAGWYEISGVAAFGANATGFRAAKCTVNGVAINASNGYTGNNGATFNTATVTPTRIVFLNVGDYVEVQGFQNSGGALSTACLGEICSALTVRWVHG
jgi:hypothetical protein